jgi:hypothetical protein
MYLAGDRFYGLNGQTSLADRSPPPGKVAAILSCHDRDGRLLGKSDIFTASVDAQKLEQIRSQVGWDTWVFGYSMPFTIAKDCIYLRSYDELICVGHAVRGSPKDDKQLIHSIRAERNAEKLQSWLTHTSPCYRHEALQTLRAASTVPSASLHKTLLEILRTDPYEENRALALVLADTANPSERPGWNCLMTDAEVVFAKNASWNTPEYTQQEESRRRILTTLRPLGASLARTYLKHAWSKESETRRKILFEMAINLGWNIDPITMDCLKALRDPKTWKDKTTIQRIPAYLAGIDAASDPETAEVLLASTPADWRLFPTLRKHLSREKLLAWMEQSAVDLWKQPGAEEHYKRIWREDKTSAKASMQRVAKALNAAAQQTPDDPRSASAAAVITSWMQ